MVPQKNRGLALGCGANLCPYIAAILNDPTITGETALVFFKNSRLVLPALYPEWNISAFKDLIESLCFLFPVFTC